MWFSLLGVSLLTWLSIAVKNDPSEGLPPWPLWVNTEKAVRLRTGDWIVYRYHTQGSVGVEVFRMDAVMTKKRWRAECKPLNGANYRPRQQVTLELDNNEVVITSDSNLGQFVERLDVATGQQIKRTEKGK